MWFFNKFTSFGRGCLILLIVGGIGYGAMFLSKHPNIKIPSLTTEVIKDWCSHLDFNL